MAGIVVDNFDFLTFFVNSFSQAVWKRRPRSYRFCSFSNSFLISISYNYNRLFNYCKTVVIVLNSMLSFCFRA